MRRYIKSFVVAASLIAGGMTASAQYWQLANQLTDMVGTALSGGMNYRGYVDASYLAGVGNNRADVLEFSTTQGAKVGDHFFMGLGAGVDVLFTHVNDGIPTNGNLWGHGTTTTGVAIPLYSDFRFNIGNQKSSSLFVDLRLGAAFLCGNSYIQVGNGYLTNSQCFYLKPTIGMRIPISSSNSKQAVNIGLSYQLMTSSTWYINNNSMTLNGLGVTAGFEW